MVNEVITPNLIERSWVQGATVTVEYLTGTAFSGENGAHTFRITGRDTEGQPVAVSGTVLAKILRADNITVDVSGSVVDGVAEVTLVGDCYNVPGRTSLVIFLSDGTNTVTLYAAIFNVFRSTSGEEIDSGVSIPTLTELLAQIERMETATAAAEAATNRAERLLETSEQTAWNQLNANTGATSTASGVTFTNNGDGTWTLTGNATAVVRKQISAVEMVVGHVYAVLNGGIDTTNMNAYVCVTKNGASLKAFNKENLFTADNDYNQFSIRTTSSFVAPEGGLTFAPMLIDLTDIYGAGNEPTLAEFRQRYPHRIYPYAAIGSVRTLDITEVHGAQIAELQDDLDDANDAITANATAITALDNAKADKSDLAHTNRVVSALVEAGKGKILRFETDDDDAYAKSVPSGALNATATEWGGHSEVADGEIVNADVNAIITKKADTTTMQTINIPSAVLTAYPLRSAGNVYDTISTDGEKWWHTKRCGELDIGSLNYTASETDSSRYTTTKPSGMKSVANNVIMSQTSIYTAIKGDTAIADYAMAVRIVNTSTLQFRNSAYTDATAFKTAMDGVMLNYELATPVVTDITDLMSTAGTDLIAMAVESGGTITFAQQNGTIFPVPNSVTYTVKISEVV